MCIRDRFIPLSFSDNLSISGKVVFAGYGITAKDLNYDDYTGVDVKDKIVIVFRNHPDMKSPHSVSYTHLRAHETVLDLVCRLLLEKKKQNKKKKLIYLTILNSYKTLI